MIKNLERRKRVMGRSLKLGHCVCNPKQGCPCEIFKKYNICQCAGEKPESKAGDIPLTKSVKKAGCASKISQADLKRILNNLPEINDPNVLLGSAAGDDAGIYKLDSRMSLVQTVDVFTPCVDDPYLFGKIAAANSVSDVYAMGGRPLTALSVIAFPVENMNNKVMEEILRGGIDKLNEASCSLIGGHSINDEELKCGFSITGLIDTEKVVKRDNAKHGDLLVLSKPLGTGILSFALQIGKISREQFADAAESMASLNKDAAELMIKYNANACTDITGFGLMGHLSAMIEGSGVSAEITLKSIPLFKEVKNCIGNEILPGAIESNMEYSMGWLNADNLDDPMLSILFDPQTSGGLLVSLSEENAGKYIKEMKERGCIHTSVIGRIIEKKNKSEVFITDSVFTEKTTGSVNPEAILNAPQTVKAESIISVNNGDFQPCCANPPAAEDSFKPASSPGQSSPQILNDIPEYKRKFSGFMQEISKPNAVDAKTKKLMAIALSVCTKCKPCLKLHIQTALGMKITRAEIDEAAYQGIMFSGAPSMMFYNEVLKELEMD